MVILVNVISRQVQIFPKIAIQGDVLGPLPILPLFQECRVSIIEILPIILAFGSKPNPVDQGAKKPAADQMPLIIPVITVRIVPIEEISPVDMTGFLRKEQILSQPRPMVEGISVIGRSQIELVIEMLFLPAIGQLGQKGWRLAEIQVEDTGVPRQVSRIIQQRVLIFVVHLHFIGISLYLIPISPINGSGVIGEVVIVKPCMNTLIEGISQSR